MTGGAGYIGSHMVDALIDAGEDVLVLDNLSGFRFLIPKTVPFVAGSTGDRELVARLIKSHRVTDIVHFAASIVVPDSMLDQLGYYHNNTMNTCLLQSGGCRQRAPRHLFFHRRRLWESGARAGARGCPD